MVLGRVPVDFFTVPEVLNLPEFENQGLRHRLGGVSLICFPRLAQSCLDDVSIIVVEGNVMLEDLHVQNCINNVLHMSGLYEF